MKILQIANRIPYPLNDGWSLAVYQVTNFLKKSGHEVTFACLNTKKHYQDPQVLKGIAKKIVAVDIDTSISIIGLFRGLFSRTPYNIRRFYSEEFCQALKLLLEEEEYDVIQIEGSYMSLYLDVIRKYSVAPVIMRSHNIEFQIWERYLGSEKNILKKIFLRDMCKKIKSFELNHLNCYDGIIAITDQDLQFYKSAGYKGILTSINAGYDPEKIISGQSTINHLKIGFLGSLEWLPNQQGLLWFLEKVWPVIYKENPQLEFHAAGKNPPEKFFSHSIPGYTFHGMVDNSKDFLSKFTILIVPLFSGSGMRLKVVEGMAMGKCIVSTSVGIEGVEAVNGIHLMVADDPDEFANCILFLTGNKEKMWRMSEKASKFAKEKYDWNILIEHFLEFYRKILQS